MSDYETEDQSVESEEVSSEPQESSQEQESAPAEKPEAEAQPNESERALNFGNLNEHPRFKELIEQKNQYAAQMQQYERALQQMQAKLGEFETAKQPKKADPLLDRLKGIDPEFGSKFEELTKAQEEIKQFKEWKAQQETERVKEQYNSGLDKLLAESKVSADQRELYDAMIRTAATNDPRIGLQDLPAVFKSVHEKVSGFIKSQERAAKASYVVDKAKDSKVPTAQPKGKVPGQPTKAKLPMDREEALAQIARNAVRSLKADSDI